MTKQNQIIAIEKGVKTRAEKVLTDVHHKLQRHELMSGLSRVYHPNDDEGERLPPEGKLLQVRVSEQIERVRVILEELFNVTATKSWTNTVAAADVVVDGAVLVKGAPVDYLLFLEKQLVNLATFVEKLPMLDPSETWVWSSQTGCYASVKTSTIRSKKVPRNHVKFEGDANHPPQVDVFTEDMQIGTWTVEKFSGALPYDEVQSMMDRVVRLRTAVKQAREEANAVETVKESPAERVLAYIFGTAPSP